MNPPSATGAERRGHKTHPGKPPKALHVLARPVAACALTHPEAVRALTLPEALRSLTLPEALRAQTLPEALRALTLPEAQGKTPHVASRVATSGGQRPQCPEMAATSL